MPSKSDQWVDAVAKLTQLTQDGTLTWIADSQTEFTNVIGPTYRADYGERRLRLQKRSVQRKRWSNDEWIEQFVLEFIDINDKTMWTFPDIDAIQHLYGAVQYQTAGVKDFLEDLLKG
jgi:hypothetical protein